MDTMTRIPRLSLLTGSVVAFIVAGILLYVLAWGVRISPHP